MNTFKFKDINSGYIKLVKTMLEKPDYHQKVTGPCTGKFINNQSRWHLRNVHIIFENVENFGGFRVKCPKRSRKMNDYAEKERKLFDAGVIDSNKMGEISKIWKLIENPDGTINANYGYMVYHLRDAARGWMSQWDWCLWQLTNNPETLKAYMHFNRPKDQWIDNMDQPCTVFTQFTVENGFLNFHSYMRSNDIIYGLPYNVYYFRILLMRMRDALKDRNIPLKVGYIHHNTTSLHLYNSKIEIAKKIVY